MTQQILVLTGGIYWASYEAVRLAGERRDQGAALLASIERLNTTMDKILDELRGDRDAK